MKIMDLFRRFQGLFRKESPELSDELVERLIHSLEDTAEDECTCEDVYAIVDEYAERQFQGEDAARLMPLIKQHLDICHDCCEEYEALLEILEKSQPA